MNSAIVHDGVVNNICMGLPPGALPCGDDVQIGWRWDGQQFLPPDIAMPALDIALVRGHALERLEQLANTLTATATGTADPQKISRYDTNMACAAAIVAGSADSHTLTIMTAMLQINQAADPSRFGSMTLDSFARWLLDLRSYLERTYLTIEAGRLRCRVAIIKSANSIEVEAALKAFEDALAPLLSARP